MRRYFPQHHRCQRQRHSPAVRRACAAILLQRIAANAVFANAPIRGGMQRDNLQRTPQEAGLYLQRRSMSGALRLDPPGAGNWRCVARVNGGWRNIPMRRAISAVARPWGNYVGAYAAPGAQCWNWARLPVAPAHAAICCCRVCWPGLAALLLGVLQRPWCHRSRAGTALGTVSVALLATLLLVSGWQGYRSRCCWRQSSSVPSRLGGWRYTGQQRPNCGCGFLPAAASGCCCWRITGRVARLPPNRAALLAPLARAHDAGWE